MSGAEAVIGGIASSISLIDNVITLIRNAQKEGLSPTASQVILVDIPREALNITNTLLGQIRRLRNSLLGANVDLSKNLEELEDDPGFFLTKRYRIIGRLRGTINGLRDALMDLEEDLVGIAVCLDRANIMCASYPEARKRAKEITSITGEHMTVGDTLEQLEAKLRDRRTELQTVLADRSPPTTLA